MKTSYFAKYKGENAISISLSTPSWFKGTAYKKLAPSWNLLNGYKNGDISKEQYINIYITTVLNKLDAREVYDDLGKDAVLMCWEKSSDFCHRHIVATWFLDKLGIEVEEYIKEIK